MYCAAKLLPKNMHRMQNWWFAIQPIVYIFSRWRLHTTFIPDSIPAFHLSVFLSRSDDNEVGEIWFVHETAFFFFCYLACYFLHSIQIIRYDFINVCRTDCFCNSTWISKFFKFCESKLTRNTYVTFANMKISVGSSHTMAKDFNIRFSKCSVYSWKCAERAFCDLRKCRSIEAGACIYLPRRNNEHCRRSFQSRRRHSRMPTPCSDQRFYPRPSINFHSYWPTSRWTCLQRSVIAWWCTGRAARLFRTNMRANDHIRREDTSCILVIMPL